MSLGKSTLLKFISSMFYGVSKNKNGKLIPDFDRFKPWSENEFSGRIKYTLDNEKKYEIFREFRKKTPFIYNENKEDITKNYPMDKSKESLFFQEQTGIAEDNFFATCISEQENVKLSSNDKNQVIQKLSNLVSTGDENTSYKKVIDRLNKMQLEKVGSARSNGRPINIAEEEIDRLEAERKEISQFEEQKYQVEEAKQTLKTDLEDNRIVLDLLRRQKVNLEKSEIEEEKLKIFKKNLAQNKEEQDLLEEKLNDLVEERKGNLKKGKAGYYIGLFLAIVISAIAFLMKKYLFFLGNIVPLIIICVQFALNKQKTRRIKKNGRRIQQERLELEERLKNLEKNYEKQEKEIEERKNEILAVQKEREKEIAKDFTNKLDEEIITDILSTDYSKIVEFIDEKEREQTDFAINEKKIELDNENIGSKLEELVEIDEKLENLYETKDNLLQLNNMYEMAKEEIENAYQAMKENITPEFIEELKQILSDVTEGKYTECYIDSENNILVETENGKYIPIELLSVGTIDLIYLALRISAAKEISKETMPIILDESFAYYDNDRMARILRYLETLDRQVIIFTCSSREKDILEKEGIKFNLISMNHA